MLGDGKERGPALEMSQTISQSMDGMVSSGLSWTRSLLTDHRVLASSSMLVHTLQSVCFSATSLEYKIQSIYPKDQYKTRLRALRIIFSSLFCQVGIHRCTDCSLSSMDNVLCDRPGQVRHILCNIWIARYCPLPQVSHDDSRMQGVCGDPSSCHEYSFIY